MQTIRRSSVLLLLIGVHKDRPCSFATERFLLEATNSSQNGGSLLAYVQSRLRPEIFTHPIWVHFGVKEKLVTPGIIKDLLNEAKQLRDEDPDSTCQVLLICAVYQNCIGQRDDALRTIQQILSLAKRTSLSQEIVWATWGACAICIQDGNYEQAAKHLHRLQIRLREQNEWILTDFIEMVEHSLFQKASASTAGGLDQSHDQPSVGLMYNTFDWLQHWGFSTQSTIPEFRAISSHLIHPTHQKTASSQPLLSGQRWQGYWHTIKRVVAGELRLQWVEKDAPPRASLKMQSQIKYSPPPNSFKFEDFLSHSSQSHIPDPSWIQTAPSPPPEKTYAGTSLLVYCMGPFRVYQDEQLIEDWPSSKGKAVFKYLVTHRKRPVIKDVLMDLFWPDIPAESARNNLNVAIYGLRQALHKTHPSYSHVLFINDCYLLNPELQIWLDYEAFLGIITAARELEESGELEAIISEYSKAETLYQGEFLAEDRYEDWLLPLRENLQTEYLSLLDRLNHLLLEKQDYQACIHLCRKMLAVDPCNEEAHRNLMRCFFERGQSYMALRQYYLCVEAIKEGMNVAPDSATNELYKFIRRHS
jgi:DNA-binding SARP family transcriptional activator